LIALGFCPVFEKNLFTSSWYCMYKNYAINTVSTEQSPRKEGSTFKCD